MRRASLGTRRRLASLTARRAVAATLALAGPLLVGACGGGGSPTELDLGAADTVTVALQNSSTLVFQNPGPLGEHRSRIEQIIKDTLAASSQLLPLARITILVSPGKELSIPEIGFGGRADAGTVRRTFDTGSSVWINSLESELFPLLAHELHHVARFRAVGLYSSLGDALVGEGLADQVSVQVAASPPPIWAVAVSGADLDALIARARNEWADTGYDHNRWFFGTSSQVPRWAGYSIGYRIIGDYLESHPGTSVAALHDAPTATFGP